MENSYRFLMISATLLLGIMLLSIFVYVFRRGALASQAIAQEQAKQQLIAENAKFEFYNKNNNTFSDIISLINLIYDYNKSVDFADTDTISLSVEVDSNKIYVVDKDVKERNKVRNKIGDLISVYDLARSTDVISDSDDTLSTTSYDVEKGTVYKYLFRCTEFKYDLENGNLKSIKMTMFQNDNYTE